MSFDRGSAGGAQEWVQPWRAGAPKRLRLTSEQAALVESVRLPLYDLAKLVARRGGSTAIDDLHQTAMERALRLLPEYRPHRGATFLTFVFWRVRAAMKDSLKAEKRDRIYAVAADRAIRGVQDTLELGDPLDESPRDRRERRATERYALAAAATILRCHAAPDSPEDLLLMAGVRARSARAIEEAVKRLDATTNALLRACFWEDKSVAEAARLVGLDYDKARYRLQSALALVGKILHAAGC